MSSDGYLDQTGRIRDSALALLAEAPQASTAEIETGRIGRGDAPAPANRSEPTHLGRYRLLHKLGQGGMGAVYLAADDVEGREVAVKVLSREALPGEDAVRRFQKEARLLEQVRHPHVANLLEFGEQDGACFLVMEFVNAGDVKGLISRHGILPERIALQIVRDVADALSSAHDRGIVHRDIKPGNILMSAEPVGNESPIDAVDATLACGLKPVVKLSDFGLARHINQSASMDLTRTGALLGTPYYIAPEQCTERGEVCPATDIYALGATLFEMLAGRPPFVASDSVKLISMHCFEDAPDLRKLNPTVSDGAARLVAKALQKTTAGRYANATHLLADVDRLLRGDAGDVELHPIVPQADGKVLEAVWEWDLKASPEQLWPLASNTERINCAVGLPAVEYTTERDAHGAARKFGTFRLGWAVMKWEEHPFEWVEGRRLGVLREFRKGPFHWFLSIVELQPRPDGGTRLKHTVRVAPRGVMGRLLAHIEINVKGRRALDRIYNRMDMVASGRLTGSPALDPFEPAPSLRKAVINRFDDLSDELDSAGAEHDCAERLVQYLKESPAQELARIRPQVLAKRLDVCPDRLVEACLHACHAGLLELHWDILCPTCRVSSSVKDTLAEIDRHSHCEACDLDFDVDFGNSVELIFRVHPELRKADLATRCIGGPEHAPHVVAQARLDAGESLELDLSLDAGTYVLRGPQLPYTIAIGVRAAAGTGRATLPLSNTFDPARFPEFRAGRQLLLLENKYDRPLLVRIERTITRTDVLTAFQASRLPLFKQLFPGEVLSRDRLSDYATCTLLAIRAANLSQLCEDYGDAAAYLLTRERLANLKQLIQTQGGQVVNESNEQLLGVFPETWNALRVAVDLLDPQQTANSDDRLVQLRAALHRGSALSTSVNGRLDYFGRTVTTAAQMLDGTNGESLVLSAELGRDREVVDFFDKSGLQIGRQGSGVHMAVIESSGRSSSREQKTTRLEEQSP